LLVLVVGCGGEVDGTPDATTWTELVGVYGDCSFADLGDAIGRGGTLTLTQSPSGVVTATYADSNARSFSLDFTSTSNTSATLARPGQPMPWFGLCWTGPPVSDSGLPIDPAGTALTLQVTSAALTYDAETLFLSVAGTVETDGDTCESRPTGSLSCSKE
jgi:hypothetical protein